MTSGAFGSLVTTCSVAVAAAIGAVLAPGMAHAHGTQPHGAPAAAQGTAERVAPRGMRLGPEVVSERAARSRTYAMGDGRFVTRFFPHPVNFKDGRDWRAIDSTLVESSRAGYRRNRANAYVAELPTNLSEPVRFAVGDAWVSFEVANAAAGASLRERGATFRSVRRAVDFDYETTPSGLKETITLHSPDAPGEFRFAVKASAGLSARKNDQGGIDFVDGDGDVRFRFTKPFMFDSADEPAVSQAVTLSLEEAGNGWSVVVRASRAWLDASERRYPVKIDPNIYWQNDGSVRFHGAERDCNLSANSPTTNYCALDYVRAGWDGSARRSNFQFDIDAGVPNDSVVLDAVFGLYMTERTTTNNGGLHVHPITRAWTSGATWNTYDGTNAWTQPGGDISQVGAELTPYQTMDAPNLWYTWRPPVDVVQGWVDGSRANHGLQVNGPENGPDGPAPNNIYRFVSSEGDPAKWPYLDVWYEQRAGALSHYSFVAPDHPELEEPRNSLELSDAGVNVANGNLVLSHSDSDPMGEQPEGELPVDRYFNSVWWGWGNHGRGWSEGIGMDVWLREMDDGSAAFYGPSGSVIRFPRNHDGTFAPARGGVATLTGTGGGAYTVDLLDTAEKFEFPCLGCAMSAASDGPGDRMEFSYRTDGAPVSAVDDQGRTYTFTADSSRRITRIDGPSGAYTYTYDAAGMLERATTPANGTSVYTYDADRRLTRVQEPDGEITTFTYTGEWGERQVASMTRTDPETGTSSTTSFTYSVTAGGVRQTDVTEPGGKVTTYFSTPDLFVNRSQSGATPPSVALSGTLAALDGGTADRNSTYGLTVDGTDADSGVASIRILVDGEPVSAKQQTCTGACPLSHSWTFKPGDFDPGVRTIRATVTATNGDVTSKAIRVTVPDFPDVPDDPDDMTEDQVPENDFSSCAADYGPEPEYCVDESADDEGLSALAAPLRKYGIANQIERQAVEDPRFGELNPSLVRFYIAYDADSTERARMKTYARAIVRQGRELMVTVQRSEARRTTCRP